MKRLLLLLLLPVSPAAADTNPNAGIAFVQDLLNGKISSSLTVNGTPLSSMVAGAAAGSAAASAIANETSNRQTAEALLLPTKQLGTQPFNAALGLNSRSSADRASDEINPKDYGARGDGSDDYVALQDALDVATGNILGSKTLTLLQKALAIFTQVTGVGSAVSGGHVHLPMGRYYSSAPLVATARSGQSFAIDGVAAGPTQLVGDNGLQINISDATYTSNSRATATVRGIEFRHATATRGGTALVITSSAFQSRANVDDVHVTGQNGGVDGAFRSGIKLVGVTGRADGIYVLLPNPSANSTPAIDGAALEVQGTALGTPAGSAGNLYAVDFRISNTRLGGGYYGLLIDGPVQGVFASNIQALGDVIGYDWEGKPSDGNELFALDNYHANSESRDIKLSNVGGVLLRGGYFYRLSGNDVSWAAIDISNSSEISVTDSQGSALGQGGPQEDFLMCVACQQVMMLGNNITSLSGAMGDFSDGGNGLVTAIGNRISSHSNPIKRSFIRPANPPQPSAFQAWGNTASDEPEGEDDDGTTISFHRPIVAGSVTASGPVIDQSLGDAYVGQSGQVLPAPTSSAYSGLVVRCPGGRPTYDSITVPLPPAPRDKQLFAVHALNCTFTRVLFTTSQAGTAINATTASASPDSSVSLVYDAAGNGWAR